MGIAWNVWEALACVAEAPAETGAKEEALPKNGAASPSAKAAGAKPSSEAKKASPATASMKPRIGSLLVKEQGAKINHDMPDYALTGNGECANSKSKSKKKKKSQKVDD